MREGRTNGVTGTHVERPRPSRDVLDLLRRTYLFRDVPDEPLERYAARLRRRRYPKGAYIVRVGEPSLEIDILVSGLVKGSRLGPDGDEAVDRMMWGPGEIFGEPGVLADGLRIMDAIAVEPTECLSLGRDDLFEIVESDPLVTRRLLARLAELTRDRAVRVGDLAFLDVPGRVARTLLELADAFGRPTPDGVRVDLPMSQRTLAGMVLATRESVNRALATLIADGAISQRSGSITLRRRDVLQARARPDAEV